MWRVKIISSAGVAVRSAVAARQCEGGSGSRSGARQCETIHHGACVLTRRKEIMRDGPPLRRERALGGALQGTRAVYTQEETDQRVPPPLPLQLRLKTCVCFFCVLPTACEHLRSTQKTVFAMLQRGSADALFCPHRVRVRLRLRVHD